MPQEEILWRESLPKVRPVRFARFLSLPLVFPSYVGAYAMVGAARGYRVSLFERNDWLGGAIKTVEGLTAPGPEQALLDVQFLFAPCGEYNRYADLLTDGQVRDNIASFVNDAFLGLPEGNAHLALQATGDGAIVRWQARF